MNRFIAGTSMFHRARIWAAIFCYFSSLCFFAKGQPHTLYISEFLAASSGQGADWIEIFNAANSAVNLSGWHLTDSAVDLTKWTFPPVIMASRSFLVVFASGLDQVSNADDLHTNFRLSPAAGQYLGLVNPEGIVVQSFPAYPGQRRGTTYGLLMSGDIISEVPGYLVPTPGQRNPSSSIDNGAGSVQFWPAGRRFSSPFYLTLVRPYPDAIVRYEIETNFQRAASAPRVPTESSRSYTGPIFIDRPVQVSARAWANFAGAPPGPLHSETYLQIDTNLTSFSSSLPLIVVDTMGSIGAEIFSEFGPPAAVSVELFDNGAGYTALSNTMNSLRASFGRLDRSGGTDCFGLRFRDELNGPTAVSVLGLPPDSEWVLRSPSTPSLLTEPLGFQMTRDLGRYAPRTRFIELFLNANGTPLSSNHYQGIYILEEKINSGPNRLALEKPSPGQSSPPEVTGGYLLSSVAHFNEPWLSAGMIGLNYEEPSSIEFTNAVRAPQMAYLQDYLQRLSDCLSGPSIETRLGTNHYSFYFDPDAAIDCQLPQFIALNGSGLGQNCFVQKPRDGRITVGPVSSFSAGAWGSLTNPRASLDDGLFSLPQWWHSLFQAPDFIQRWMDRYQELRDGPWQTNRLAGWIDRFAEEVRDAQPRGVSAFASRRPRSGIQGLAGYTHKFDGTYGGEVEFLKRWLFERLSFLDSQFLGRPSIVAEGSRITLIDNSRYSNSRLYYTLDGSDPRAVQGGISSSALQYTRQFTLSHNAAVQARAFNNSSYPGAPVGTNNPANRNFWSGLSQARVSLRPPQVRVTEVMYHPAAGSTASISAYDRDQFQFIEFKNFEPIPIEMSRMHLAGEVEFTFPRWLLQPNQYVLAVRNRAAFETRYGPGWPVAGEFEGSLSSASSTLRLQDVLDDTLIVFTYDDAWYPLTDGPGLGLVAASDSDPQNVSLRSAWRAGKLIHGSPGRGEPDIVSIMPVLINEILSNPKPPYEDVVELYNPNAQPADISFWYLTDDSGQPRKFRLPAGTILPPYGFLSLDEHAFNPFSEPPLPTSFSFNALGDEAYLFSGNSMGELTGYVHGFRFGAAAPEVAFGRVVLGEDEQFLPESKFSFNESNAPPAGLAGQALAALAVSEIMSRARSFIIGTSMLGEVEFLELHNSGNLTLDLTGIKLSGAVRFTFPPWLLPPDSHVLVVKNEETFSLLYGTNLPVAGQYDGALSVAGEELKGTDSRGEVLFELRFPPATSVGLSLVPSAGGWRNSTRVDGSPGTADPEPADPAARPVVINECFMGSVTNAAERWIELFNPNSEPHRVWLEVWFQNIRVASTNVVVAQNAFSFVPVAFGALVGSIMVGIYDQYLYDEMPLMVTDEYHSIGRYLTKDGRTIITTLAAPTPEGANGAPLLSPVFISEVHATPAQEQLGSFFRDGEQAYIELHNLSSVEVPLHAPKLPQWPWGLQGTVSYRFPAATYIAPHGTLLVVGFDPSIVTAAERFRRQNGIPASTPIFGPWAGNLGSGPWTLELSRVPLRTDGSPITPPFGPQYSLPMDRVQYLSATPWPSLIAPWSLQRLTPLTYGDDASSWERSLPTPGIHSDGEAPTVIVTQPQSQSVPLGGTATFSVVATGPSPFYYQWQYNGFPLAQGTNRVLTLERVELEQGGAYSVLVAGRDGAAAASSNASLSILPTVAIAQQPVDTSVRIAPDPRAAPVTNAIFQVVAFTANPPLSWQWLRDGRGIPGATNPILTVPNISLADEGDYACALTDQAGTALSKSARLSPLISPRFLVRPADQAVLSGQVVHLSAMVSGHPPPFSFEWRAIRAPRFTNIYTTPSNASFWSFTASSTPGVNSTYRVIVRNAANPIGVATNFTVTTTIDSDGDGLPDAFELAHHFDPAGGQNGTLDADGDGVSNRDEYLAGTDPLDPLSHLKLELPAEASLPLAEISLQFFAASNHTYSVQYQDGFGPSWKPFAEVPADITNRVIRLTDPFRPGELEHRRYRLVTPRAASP